MQGVDLPFFESFEHPNAPRMKPIVLFAALWTTLLKNPVRFTLRAQTIWIKILGSWQQNFSPNSSVRQITLLFLLYLDNYDCITKNPGNNG